MYIRFEVEWKFETPVFLRGNASIVCMIPDENDIPGHMAWTKDGKLIGLNIASSNSTKYDLSTKYSMSSMVYTLIIKDIALDDLNMVYKCESGFSSAAGILPLNEDTFVALPRTEDISRKFTMKDGLIHVVLEVSSVYPLPKCVAAFKAKNITNFSTTKYFNESSLYSMTFDLNYQTDECGNITTSCVIGKNAISSLDAANEVKHCERE
ncbi:unnamed protein product [Mytilus edulis]|uniref:Ig-like domain-containing protein n=1 Tax=Mytilus edulis TaxID=6550 RepID=A0A8S3SUT8_MYTED|nr:unnamed protein product [Mytilus edulis]